MINQLLFQLCKYLYENYRGMSEYDGNYGSYIMDISKEYVDTYEYINHEMTKTSILVNDNGYVEYDSEYIPRMIELIRDTKLYDDKYIQHIVDKLEKFAHTSEV